MQTAPNIQSTKPRRPTATSYRPIVRRLGQGVYQIGSRTVPGALYTVTLTGRDTHVCTCPAYTYGRDCWHHAAARQASAFFSKWYSQAVPRVVAPVMLAPPPRSPSTRPSRPLVALPAWRHCKSASPKQQHGRVRVGETVTRPPRKGM